MRIVTRGSRRSLIAAAFGLGAALTAACSLIVEHRDRQCSTNAECASFKNAVCDVAKGVCVEKAGPGCIDPSGCYSCPPKTTHEYQTACTDAECVPYSNAALKKYMTADGGLPPIPDASAPDAETPDAEAPDAASDASADGGA